MTMQFPAFSIHVHCRSARAMNVRLGSTAENGQAKTSYSRTGPKLPRLISVCRFRLLRARNTEHLHRSHDVFKRDLTLVVQTQIDPVTDLIVNSKRDRNESGRSDAFDTPSD